MSYDPPPWEETRTMNLRERAKEAYAKQQREAREAAEERDRAVQEERAKALMRHLNATFGIESADIIGRAEKGPGERLVGPYADLDGMRFGLWHDTLRVFETCAECGKGYPDSEIISNLADLGEYLRSEWEPAYCNACLTKLEEKTNACARKLGDE